MIYRKYILFIFLLIGLNGFSQTDESPFRIWQLTSYSGQANLRANYRATETTLNNIYSQQSEKYFNGIFQLKTQSFIVHPNFLFLNLNGVYNPETRRSSYIGIPDYNEKNNTQGYDGSAVFFKKKDYNLTGNLSNYSSIQDIDNITRIRNKNLYYGGIFSYFNKILPVTLSISKQKNDQNTIGVDRSYSLDQRLYQANANKSFTADDSHSFTYLRNEFSSTQKDVGFIVPIRLFNKIEFFSLNDAITFGRTKNFTFSSAVANSDERGSIFRRDFTVQENLTMRLPRNFIFSNNYNYMAMKQESTTFYYQRFQSLLSHQLFESLNTRLLYEHLQNDETNYKESRNKGELDLRYLKKIKRGKIIMTYAYYKEFQNVTTPPSILNIYHEAYTLADNQVTMLANQYVDMQTVVVKDVTGNTIYQLNFDYILIDKNTYVEIMRIPGGMIANNQTVYVDYTSSKPGLYKYAMNNHNLNADVWVLNNTLDFYYRYYSQDYSNQVRTENQVFNTFVRHIVGARADFHTILGGVEYEYCRSNILPYQGMKYFLTFQKMYNKIYITLNGNLTDYQYNNELIRRRDYDFRGNISYSVVRNVKIMGDYMYRSMRGQGINMDIQNTKLEITANLHRLFVTLGSELYWSKSLGNNTYYRGVYAQITRNF